MYCVAYARGPTLLLCALCAASSIWVPSCASVASVTVYNGAFGGFCSRLSIQSGTTLIHTSPIHRCVFRLL
ncbi:hypothetical protein DFP72DRAFT_941898 [Ephemerocybe angulata]|uniref:Secreted protein n=1 Tax=Ephemerocybe angulata TaxID=980116 RepID=A0A8H6LTJ9_9AGAR|nr:hypothetical protein DFP72DRAFT_941898 [Tulosesus angulatus]